MLHGFLVVNKPKGIISHDVVYRLRRKLGKQNVKIGHTGTLDPFAEGILVLCLGAATKLTKKMQYKDKVYIAELKLGVQTNTDDITGEVIAEKTVAAEVFEKLPDILQKFVGEIEQKPPLYSAISVNGKRLYQYARKNKAVEIPTRKVFVKSIEIVDKIDKKNNLVNLKIECASGTYIRSLARDIGNELGVGGTLENLNRIEVGKFKLADSVYYFDLINKFELNEIKKRLISLEDIFNDLEKTEILDVEYEKLLKGNFNFLEEDLRFNEHKIDGKIIKLIFKEKIKAVVKYSNDKFCIEYLFGNNE